MSIDWIISIATENWEMFLRGAWMTLLIATLGTVFGAIIGLLIGIINTIPKPERGLKRIVLKLINIILGIYVGFFRGTPMIVQAMVVFYGAAQAYLV